MSSLESSSIWPSYMSCLAETLQGQISQLFHILLSLHNTIVTQVSADFGYRIMGKFGDGYNLVNRQVCRQFAKFKITKHCAMRSGISCRQIKPHQIFPLYGILSTMTHLQT